MKQWYAVHCRPKSETKAETNLLRQGFATLMPRYRKRVRHARLTREVLAPLFPRYLFVAFDRDAERWRSVNGTFGVIGLVGFGGQPTVIDEEVIEAIRAGCDSNGITDLETHAFTIGQKVRVENGPFTDIVGLFETMDDRQRVTLLLDILGRPVRVTLPAESLTAA